MATEKLIISQCTGRGNPLTSEKKDSTFIVIRASKYKTDTGVFYRVSAIQDQQAIDYHDTLTSVDVVSRIYHALQQKYFCEVISEFKTEEFRSAK